MQTKLSRAWLRPIFVCAILVLSLLAANVAYATPPSFSEDFDASTTWPAGWVVGGDTDTGWSITSPGYGSTGNQAFTSEPWPIGDDDRRLYSPPLIATSAAATVSFMHYIDCRSGTDGGVLEISFDGINWSDIVDAGGGFDPRTDGYNSTITGNPGNPLNGRDAWGGRPGAWWSTTARLPASANGQALRLRWRMGRAAIVIVPTEIRWAIDSITSTGLVVGNIWTGTTNTLWDDKTNWGGFPIYSASHLVFGADGASNRSNSNNLAAGYHISSLTFWGYGYTLGGNSITLGTGGVTDDATSGGNRSNLPITLSSGTSTTFDVSNAGETLTIGGALSTATGGISKTGNGTLVLASGVTHSLPGGVEVNGGTLQADATSTAGTTIAYTGTILSGSGTLANAAVNPGATLSPGSPATSAGTLHVGNLSFGMNSTYAVQINGAASYDQVATTGNVTLSSGVTLHLTGSYNPAIGDQFTIINNGGSSSVSGIFDGLPEGATVTFRGRILRISYQGGSGNDVVLTNIATISGTKFNDANHNGTKDGGESGLSGWTIQLKNASGTVLQTTTTDSSGNYAFIVSTAATYSICEVAQTGWTQTLPGSGCISITISSAGADVANQNFGNVQYTDLGINKTAPATADAGDALDYAIAVINSGPLTAPSVIVTDTLPTGITYTSSSIPASWTCAGISGNKVQCSRTGDMPIATETLTLHTSISTTAAAGDKTNSAVVTTSMYDNNAGNNSDTAITTVHNSVDMSVTKTADATSILPGSNIVYTLVARNNGTSRAYGVAVSDTMDSDTTFVSINSGGATCTTPAVGANGPVNCSLGTVEPGGASTIEITVKVDPAAASGATISDTATVTTGSTDTNTGNNSATVSLMVQAIADLAISKTAPATVDAGDNLSYLLIVTNLGPSSATNVVVTDTLPISVTAPIGWQVNGWSCSGPDASHRVVCSRASLDPGVQTITISATVPSTTPNTGILVNTAQINSTTTDPVSGNNTGSWSTTVRNNVNQSITKTADRATVGGGDYINYTILVKNNGTSAAHSVRVTDTLPANLSFVSLDPHDFGCTSAGTITCDLDYLAAGASQPIGLVAQVSPEVPDGTVIQNTAFAVNANNSVRASSSTNVTVQNHADLRVSKVGTPSPVVAGTNLVYAIQVENLGPNVAHDVEMQDTIPSATTFVSASAPSGWSCTGVTPGGTGTLSCERSLMSPGSDTLYLTVKVNSNVNAGAVITNTVTVTSSTDDPDSTNNTSSSQTTVLANADLRVSKSASPDPSVTAGTDLTYILVVENYGPSDASSPALSDTINTPALFKSLVAPAGWSCTVPAVGASGTVQCTKTNALAAGSSAAFSIIVTIPSGVSDGTNLSNTASILSTTPDPQTNNNSSTTTTLVSTQSNLGLTKSVNLADVSADADLVYTLVATNSGPSDAVSVRLVDTLPAYTGFQSAAAPAGWSCTGSVGGSSVSCTTVSLAKTGMATITIVARVGGDVPDGTVLVNRATLDAAPSAHAAASANTTAHNVEADLSITKTGAPHPSVLAGTDLSYTILVKNNGPTSAYNPTLNDTVDSPMTFQSLSAPADWVCTTPAVGATGAVQCNKTSAIDAGGAATFTLVVRVPSSLLNGTNLSNTASVSSTTADPNAGNNSSTNATYVQTRADVRIAKNAPATGFIGTDLTYTLVVTNNGPSDAQFVVASDPFPSHTTFVSASEPSGWTCTTLRQAQVRVYTNGGITCRAPQLASGASATISIVLHVAPDTTAGTDLSTTGSVEHGTTDPDLASNTATASITAAKAPSTTTLTSSANPSHYYRFVTFTAVVNASITGLSGTVTFKANGVVIPGCASVALVSGSASCSYGNLVTGSHTISAEYTGNALDSAGTTTQLVQYGHILPYISSH